MREQQIQDRLMTALERGFTARIARMLRKASKGASAEAERMGALADISTPIRTVEGDMVRLFEAHYQQTASVFGRRILDAAKSHARYETKADDLFLSEMQTWIKTMAAKRVVDIMATTEAAIRSALEDGLAEQLTGSALAKRIVEETGGEIAKRRAIVIARTETHMASNQANMEAIRSTGIPVRKVWISAEDDRTRDTHAEADRSSHEAPLGRDELFEVGLDSMLMPGLGSLAEENVNCRCVVGWVTD